MQFPHSPRNILAYIPGEVQEIKQAAEQMFCSQIIMLLYHHFHYPFHHLAEYIKPVLSEL